MIKERTSENVADLRTKNVEENKMLFFLGKFGFEFREGRASQAPKLHGVNSLG